MTRQPEYDALIVGGRAAGGSLALLLARQGRRVLFMLAEALGMWFDGAEWEVTMSGFQQRRDQTMKPMYQATLDFTRMRDVGLAEQAVLKAVFMSPPTTRALAHGMLLQLPTLLSPLEHKYAMAASRMFAPPSAPTKA